MHRSCLLLSYLSPCSLCEGQSIFSSKVTFLKLHRYHFQISPHCLDDLQSRVYNNEYTCVCFAPVSRPWLCGVVCTLIPLCGTLLGGWFNVPLVETSRVQETITPSSPGISTTLWTTPEYKCT